MNKLLIGLLGAAVIGSGGYAAASGVDDSTPARTVSIPAATTDGDTTTSARTEAEVEDVSGPCDEAEHANDPRCAGVTTAQTTAPAATTAEREVEDVSGPCDEAEHANDPRCAGVTTLPQLNDDDNDNDEDHAGRGRGGDDRGGDDHGDDDRSGSNSGKG